MAEKKKPQEDLVALAGRAMKDPGALKGSDIKRMAARILDDQRNDPEPNKAKPSVASQVVAKVADLLPAALVGDSKSAKPAGKSATKAPPQPKTKPAPASDDTKASTAPAAKPKKAEGKPASQPAPKEAAKASVKAAPSAPQLKKAPEPATKAAPAKATPKAKK